jgi:hypothetical protein
MDVLVEVPQGKFEAPDSLFPSGRQARSAFRFQVMQSDAGEVRDDDVPRNFFLASFAQEVMDIREGLRFSRTKVLASALVFDEEDAGPEEVDECEIAREFADGLLEARDGATTDPEGLEELVPESLLVGCLAPCARPVTGETDCVLSDLVPGNRHAQESSP